MGINAILVTRNMILQQRVETKEHICLNTMPPGTYTFVCLWRWLMANKKNNQRAHHMGRSHPMAGWESPIHGHFNRPTYRTWGGIFQQTMFNTAESLCTLCRFPGASRFRLFHIHGLIVNARGSQSLPDRIQTYLPVKLDGELPWSVLWVSIPCLTPCLSHTKNCWTLLIQLLVPTHLCSSIFVV